MQPEFWVALAPLAGAVLVGLYKGTGRFFRWVVKKAVDEFVSGLAAKWRADIQSAIAKEMLVETLQGQWKTDIDSALATALRPVLDELMFNGGTSVKDIVHRIERSVEELHHGRP